MSSTTSTPLLAAIRTPTVRISNPQSVERLLRFFYDGGLARLQVIADFDYTLTRVHRDGVTLDCSWGVMGNSHLLPDSYVQKASALKDHYLPIELDPHMTPEQKTPYMVEWYQRANALLISECRDVSQSMFDEMVKMSNVELRDGTEKMLTCLRDCKVPTLVLSAGLGDLVIEILRAKKVYYTSNLRVVSNFLSYDECGRVCGLKGDVIHVFNKNEKSLLAGNDDFFETVRGRSNVLLMGDSLGDLNMSDGVDHPDANILKVGFFNHGETSQDDQKRLKLYMEAFDVVLVDDQTMNVPNAILENIVAAVAATHASSYINSKDP